MGSNDEQPRKTPTPPAGTPKKRAASIMGDDERAMQPRVRSAAPPVVYVEHERTPPPILIDDIGKPISRTMVEDAVIDPRSRKRATMQEAINQLWPARHAMDMIVEHLQRIVVLEEKQKALEADGPSAVAAAKVAELRAILIGEDGDGGMMGEMRATISRDMSDHKAIVHGVEERATKADKFVRRVIYAAAGTIGGSLIAAVALIYSAGEHAATARAEAAASRLMIDHQIEQLNDTMSDMKDQLHMLINAKLDPK